MQTETNDNQAAGGRSPKYDIARVVARGKRLDLFFGILGAVLIFLSLGILMILVGDLFIDGAGKVAHTHEVKEDGRAPGVRDLIGVLKREKRGEADAYVLVPDPIPTDFAKVPAEAASLVGKRVLVTGLMPEPGEGAMEVEQVKAAPPAGEPVGRLGRNEWAATLQEKTSTVKGRKLQYAVALEPIEVDVTAAGKDVGPLVGQRVAVEGRRARGAAVFAAEDVARLKAQTFVTSMPSRTAHRAGIYSAWVGSIVVMIVTICTALPLGVAAGIYLEEYARKNWFTALIEINIANLAGVPSIIWGLMGLGLFVYKFHLGLSVLTAGLTLGLLVLPIVIIATRESIRAIPSTIRDASLALGATKWQTTRHHVLPYSFGGILTGTIVALSRAIGETAPLITIGALTYVTFLPAETWKGWLTFGWLRAPFTVLPIQMFNWLSRPDREFHRNAAASGALLIVMTLGMNAIAIVLRYRLRRKIKW